MTFWDFFKRRKMGPLSVSPVGVVVFFVVAAAAWTIAEGVYRDKAIQQDLFAAVSYARPIATQARWMHEQTGKWPGSLGDLRIAEAKRPPQIAQVQLRQDQGVRLLFASPEAIAGKSMILRVVSRDSGRFLECEADELPQGPLPPICKGRGNAERLSWPPAAAYK
jgi:hypothetical protein